MLTFNHFNFNVSDLDKSLAFYKEALGLEPVGERKEAADGSFIIVYLGDGKTDFRLELTWLRDHPQKYDLGECEFHLESRYGHLFHHGPRRVLDRDYPFKIRDRKNGRAAELPRRAVF